MKHAFRCMWRGCEDKYSDCLNDTLKKNDNIKNAYNKDRRTMPGKFPPDQVSEVSKISSIKLPRQFKMATIQNSCKKWRMLEHQV